MSIARRSREGSVYMRAAEGPREGKEMVVQEGGGKEGEKVAKEVDITEWEGEWGGKWEEAEEREVVEALREAA
jgi:hypothetical protein